MFQPESVYVEVSGICSAKCPYCVKGNGLQKQGKYISQGDFRRILDHLKKHALLPKRNIINLYIWGEPLLHPEINEILSIVNEHGQKAYMSTFLPRPPKLSRESLQILHGMTLSLSGITQESYGRIHGHKIDAMLQNFNLLMEAVKSSGVSWRPMVNWHRYRFNESEMETARKHFEKAGALFAPTVADFNDIERTERFVLNQLDPAEEERLDEDLFTGYLRHCIQQSQRKDHECSQWDRLTIDEKGNVLLCCGLANSVEGSVLGPIFDYDAQSLRKVKTSSHLCTPCIQTGIAKYCDSQTHFSLDDFLQQHPSERLSSLRPQPITQPERIESPSVSLVPSQEGLSRTKPGTVEVSKASLTSATRPALLVSIGVPLYNEERFISKTLDSLLAQDYTNWEMIISDDASTDRSGKICEQYARKDPRIRYLRNRNNLGCVRNCNRLVELASGEYFLWAFQHDLYEPTYLSRCVEFMKSYPDLALCYSRTSLIDVEGEPLGLAPDVLETRGLSPVDAFRKIVREMVSGNMMFGLFRTDLLARTTRLRSCFGHDLVLAAELCLKGSIAQIQEPLFHRRQNRSEESAQEAHQRWVRMLQSQGASVVAPYLFMVREYLDVVRNSKLADRDKESSFSEVVARFGQQVKAEIGPFDDCAMELLRAQAPASQSSRLASHEFLSLCDLLSVMGEGNSPLRRLRSLCLLNLGLRDSDKVTPLAKDMSPFLPAQTGVETQSGLGSHSTLPDATKTATDHPPTAPRISFVTIVLNGMPFLEYCLKAIYGVAHEIFIVEGAVEQCSFAANPDGSSKDGTVECIRNFPDPEHKIRLIQGRWPEKVDMQNAALKRVTGDYVWLVDSDEIYKEADLRTIQRMLQQDPSITQVNFIPDNFWKGFDYVVSSPGLFQPDAHFRRVFKFAPDATFTSHRPPTMRWPSSDRTTEQMHLIGGSETRAQGIGFCHYSYVEESEVQQKIELYRRYSWGQSWQIDLNQWYEECFRKWTPTNREIIEKQYPIWTADRNSRTEVFRGAHPEVMQQFIQQFRARHNRSVLPPNALEASRIPATQSRAQVQLHGFTHFENGRYAEALSCFEQILDPSRRDQGIQFIRARCLIQLGRRDEATTALRAELEIQPNHPDARKLLETLQPTSQLKANPPALSWGAIQSLPVLRLYAGDVPATQAYANWVGLSLNQQDPRHLKHDMTCPLPLPDRSVDSFQAEDVLEHIAYEKLVPVINEIYRVLKPGALFRLSVPDYGCDVLRERSLKTPDGTIVFDPGGGGTREKPGHLWFPTYPNVKRLLDLTHFARSGKVEFLHYYRPDGTFVADSVDYSKGYVQRTPDHDPRVQHPYRPMSLIVDLTKASADSLRLAPNLSRASSAVEVPVFTPAAGSGFREMRRVAAQPLTLGNASIPKAAKRSLGHPLCEEARTLLSDGKWAEAERAVQIALEQQPNDPEACLLFREVRAGQAIGLTGQREDTVPDVLAVITPEFHPAGLLPARFPGVTFGDGVQVIGLRNVRIGEGSCIGDHTWINVCQRDQETRIRIGRSVLVGRQSMISTGGKLEIGDFCVLAPRVYISDADHAFSDIGQPILQQGATLNRSVIVEENCWLGINTVISGNLTVGKGSIVAANSVVIDDVPPFCVVAGSPATIIKMYNPKLRLWERTRSAEDRERVQRDRNSSGLPDRVEYQRILSAASTFRTVDPIAAGRGLCI